MKTLKTPLVLLVTVLVASCCFADTGQQIVTGVMGRHVAFSASRFPDSVMLGIINDMTSLIATTTRAKEADTTYVPASMTWILTLPADYYLRNTLTMNKSPIALSQQNSTGYRLAYVPWEDYGVTLSPRAGRPDQFSVWNGSLYLNKMCLSGLDTLKLLYWAFPTALDTLADTVDLPGQYIPLLKAYVLKIMFDRIRPLSNAQAQGQPFLLPGEAENNRTIEKLEALLYGRPNDAKSP